MALRIADARIIISAAFEHARRRALPPLGVAVLDGGGHLLAFEREDGSPNRRFDVAYAKAHGAISFGSNSRTLGDLALQRPQLLPGLTAAASGSLVAVAGGVIINQYGTPVGAVGVSGATSDQDEEAAIAGIAAAGFTPAER